MYTALRKGAGYLWQFWGKRPTRLHRLQRQAVISGRRDAADGVPARDESNPPAFLRELKGELSQALAALAEQWGRRDAMLHSRYPAVCQAARLARAAQLEAAMREHASRERCDQVLAQAEQLYRDLYPPDQWWIPEQTYGWALLLLSVLDLPLSYLAFQVLELPPLLTGALSLLVVLLLNLVAHGCGYLARRLRVGERALLYSTLGLSAGFIVSLAVMRENSVAALQTEQATISPLGSSLAFLALAAAGFAVPTLLSYHLAYQPLPGPRAEARRALRKAQAVAAGARRRWQRALGRLARICNRRRQWHAACCHRAGAWQWEFQRLMARYVAANVQVRHDHECPRCLQEEALPTLALPACLSTPLTWSPPLELAERLLSGDHSGTPTISEETTR